MWHDFGGPSEFRGGGIFNPPQAPAPRYATAVDDAISPVIFTVGMRPVGTASRFPTCKSSILALFMFSTVLDPNMY